MRPRLFPYRLFRGVVMSVSAFGSRRVVAVAVSVAVGVSLPWVVGVGDAFSAGSEGGGSLSAAMGAMGGVVDERTGEARFAPALGGVSGPAGSGLEVKAQFSQRLSQAGVDRFGLGPGVSLGLPFVDVERGVVVLASGEQVMDESSESGFRNYRMADARFRAVEGSEPVAHGFVMESVKDGSSYFFDAAGDLAAVEDRFGHVTKLTWSVVNGKHRLVSVAGGWGSKLTVAYKGSDVVFTSPKRWGQAQAPSTVLRLSQGRVESVTDPAGEKTSVEWAVHGSGGVAVPSAVVSPAGARTEFSYRDYEPRSGSVVAVSGFEVKGADGETLIDPVSVSLDPDGANGGRNFTGCPEYCPDGTDRLENSGDGGFTYRVLFAQKNGQEVERTYNALHLKKREVARVKHGSQAKEVSRTELSYPGEKDGAPPKIAKAPGDYQMPSKVVSTVSDPADGSRSRSAEATTAFDDMGRQVRQVQDGVETVTEYGPNSIPVRTETKDVDSGARRVVESTPTSDGKAVAKTVTKAAKAEGDDLRQVSATEFTYHSGELAGEVAKSSSTGDSQAGGGDPGPAVTATDSRVEKDGEGVGRRTTVTTGADGVQATSVSDLASGAALSERVGDLGETVTEYDVADRPVKATGADGTVTTTSYDLDDEGGGSVTRVRESDGFASRTVSDELGRTVATESNYRPSGNDGEGEILPEGQWRQTSAARFNGVGQQVAAVDVAGRETVTEYDAWGVPSKVTTPDGTQALATHDDVAGTKTTQTVPAGADKPITTVSETVDEQGRPVKSETGYGDDTPGIVTSKQFDGFGQQTRTQSSNTPLGVEHHYTPGGELESDTITGNENGQKQEQAAYTFDAFGVKTHKTLSRGGESVGGWKSETDAAGRATQTQAPGGGGTIRSEFNEVNGLVDAVTGPDGAVAHQRYDAAGRVTESWTSPKDDPEARHEHTRTSYDAVTGQVAAVWFDGDEDGSKITFGYHPDGSVKERIDPGGKSTSFTYNDEGKVLTVTDHTGAVTTSSYEESTGRLTGAVQTRDGQELGKVSYGYDAAGRLVKTDRGNGAVSTYT
ncbi:hypothetical protein ACFV6B_39480, partial [Streptomyces microflavus]|uniref:hypothetical protein n=1 Tax=Streptomyces microflavus TaxID=1919 RepID=UPI00365A0A85